MPIRITGLNSGLDTESIISALVSSYNYKTDKYKKAQTKLSWKQDAWKELNTKIYSLYKNVGNLRLGSSYNLKSATVSDSSKVSVTAGSNAVNGSYSVQVTDLAKSGYLTGAKIKEDTKLTTTLEELGYTGDKAELTLTIGGKEKKVTFEKTQTVGDVLEWLKKGGGEDTSALNASFDTTNSRFFVSAKKSGASGDFSIGGNGELLKALGLNTAKTTDYKKMAAYSSLTKNDVEAIRDAKQNIEIYEEAIVNYTNAKKVTDEVNMHYNETDSEAKFDKLKELAKRESASFTTEEQQLLHEYGFSTEDEEGNFAVKDSWTDFKNAVKTMDDIEQLVPEQSEFSIEILENKISEAETLVAGYGDTELIDASMSDDEVNKFLTDAAYAKNVVNGVVSPEYTDGATYVKGSDAVIYVNGARYTSDSNTFSINGMTITATGITGIYNPYELNAVTVNVNTDTQGIYDKIKDFLSQYNALINEMTSLYNADSAKGYEPLTDEEKDAMSETEAEKWEEKIKASLLRRDNTLSGIINTMTSVMSKGVNVDMDGDGEGDGKTYYLSDFGIKTLGFLNAPKNEQNAYHIDGDEDDTNTSGNADKLMAAITENPDTVINFMKGLAKNLYQEVDKKMKSTTLSSSYTIYNDKEMASEYSDYTSLISKWQNRLEQQEEYYYNKFAAMEKAMAELNSQTSSLSGLFGM